MVSDLGNMQISPLEGLHEESLLDAEEQLRLVISRLRGLQLLPSLALLNGSFGDWLAQVAGIQVCILNLEQSISNELSFRWLKCNRNVMSRQVALLRIRI